jgi:hypothetical protein
VNVSEDAKEQTGFVAAAGAPAPVPIIAGLSPGLPDSSGTHIRPVHLGEHGRGGGFRHDCVRMPEYKDCMLHWNIQTERSQ